MAKVATPSFSAVSGSGSVTVTITCATGGAAIKYSTNGAPPSPTNGTLYTEPIVLTSTSEVQAYATLEGDTDSDICIATYTITATGGGNEETDVTDLGPPVAGIDCTILISAGGSTPTVGMGYSKDFTLAQNTALVKGPVTQGSFPFPAYFADGEQTCTLDLNSVWDPTGISTNAILSAFNATADADKILAVIVSVGGYIVSGSCRVTSIDIKAEMDGKKVEYGAKLQIFSYSGTTGLPQVIASVPTVGVGQN